MPWALAPDPWPWLQLMAAVVVMELSTELVHDCGDAGVSVLLGLSMDELDSRQRHTPHLKHHGQHSSLFEMGAENGDYPTRKQLPFTSFGRVRAGKKSTAGSQSTPIS